MKVGVGFPAMIPGVGRDMLLAWARRADEGPFSSLGLVDRVVFGNHEPLIALAAAAAVTERIRLMTTILLAPTRNAAILAKQAASLDVLSNGRLTLGLGIGARPDDYAAAGQGFRDRGRRFEEQLVRMRRIWTGEPVIEGLGPVGPRPVQEGGPELLIGGYAPRAVRRVGAWADGYMSGGGGDPARAAAGYRIAEEAWREAGRQGRPRFVGAVYAVLGADAEQRGRRYLQEYYGDFAERIPLLASPGAVLDLLDGAREVGMDEVVFWATVPELEQLDRLADVAAR